MHEAELNEQLATLDACAVSDAMDRVSIVGSVTSLLRLATRQRVCGKVITVKLAAGPAPGGSHRHLCTGAIEAAGPGSVIVVEQSTGVDAAGWGGVLSNAAAQRGLSGVIVEGPARDVDEADALGFPVFARRATCRTARGRVHEASFGEPVRVGEVEVRTGDYVVADASGVVFIPAARVEEVVAVALSIAAREGLMTRDVRAGRPVSEVMGADYETMLQAAS